MISIVVLRSAIEAEKDPIVSEFEWQGDSIADIVQRYRHPDWDEEICNYAISVNGRAVKIDEMGRVARDGTQIVIAPVPGVSFAIALAYKLIVAAIVYYAASLILPKPDAPDNAVGRDDVASPVSSWDQIYSTYKQGFPIPIGYGERDVGGTVLEAWSSDGIVNVILATGVGRIESIGGVTGGDYGEADRLTGVNGTTFPSNVRVDGNLITGGSSATHTFSARADVRMGEDDQSVTPAGGSGVTQTSIPASGVLNDAADQVIISVLAAVQFGAVRVDLVAPSGAWQLDSKGKYQLNPILLDLSWRPLGTTAWITHPLVQTFFGTGTPPTSRTRFKAPLNTAITTLFKGPIEVRIVRGPKAATTGSAASDVQVTGVSYTNSVGRFAYPGVGLIALEVRGNDVISSARPQFRVRTKQLRVRVWDTTINSGDPSTDFFYEVPPAGDAYVGIWSYPPGKNPAWCCADLLTREDVMGAQRYSDDDIDWAAFRDWADFCDQDESLSAGVEAAFQVDITFDSPEEALVAILHIMSAGHAKPVMTGKKFSVKYEYSDAHGRGTNSVPAKARSFLITSGNMTDFAIDYVNTKIRPAVLLMQFPDETQNYGWDGEPVNDPNGGFQDPATFEPLGVTKVAQRLRGVVRRSQARREGLYIHAANYYITSRVKFKAGPDTLAAEIGDVVGVEHVSISPYSTETYGYRQTSASGAGDPPSASTSVHIDHAVTLEVGIDYEVILREYDGTIVTRSVSSAGGTYAAGAAITIDASAQWLRASPIAIGVVSSVVRDYLITKISLDSDMFRQVEAVNWEPLIYSVDNVGSSIEDESTSGVGRSTAFAGVTEPVDDVIGITVEPSAAGGGGVSISWGTPGGRGAGAAARVYIIPEAELVPYQPGLGEALDPMGAIHPIGEVEGDTMETEFLTPGKTYQIAVAIRGPEGLWQRPDEAFSEIVTIPEFPSAPPSSVRNLVATTHGAGIALSWAPIDSAHVDYFEIRAGLEWISGHRVARTSEHSHVVASPMPGLPYMVRARFVTGLFSRAITRVDAPTPAWGPEDGCSITDTDLSAFPGTLSDLTYDSGAGELSISSGKFTGTWTTAVFDLAYTIQALALFRYYPRYHHDVTIQEMVDEFGDFGVQSGEASWRTIAGREPSTVHPGLNLSETIAELDALPAEDQADRGTHTYHSEVGEHVRHYLEVKYDGGSYEPFSPSRRLHKTAQFRLTLTRRDLNRNIYITDARVLDYA